MTQPSLFDPNTTAPQRCQVPDCTAVRPAGQNGLIQGCRHDLDRNAGIVGYRRPKLCVNTIDPATYPWPEGF